MSNAYADLADALNVLPNGFPRTETGSDLHLLEFMYGEKEAELASRLTNEWDTADSIAGRMNGKMALLVEKYMIDGGAEGIMRPQPAVHRAVPILETAELEWILPYDNVLKILDNAQTFHVQDCICRKQKEALGEGCEAHKQNCLSFSTVKRDTISGDITKEDAIMLLKKADEASLVHSVSIVVNGVNYICNCCGCCCGVLRGITEWGIENSMARANYEAVVTNEKCAGCKVCLADARCRHWK